MKSRIAVWAVAACGLVSTGGAQIPSNSRGVTEHRFQEREAIYGLFVEGRAQEAVVRLAALPVPKGLSQELFLAGELFRLSLEARNGQEAEAAAQAANMALDLLTPSTVSRLEARQHRAQAWALRARIYELILPDSNAARGAWQLALAESPGDMRATEAIRKLDEREAFTARQREAVARDPMLQPGYKPTPAQPGAGR